MVSCVDVGFGAGLSWRVTTILFSSFFAGQGCIAYAHQDTHAHVGTCARFFGLWHAGLDGMECVVVSPQSLVARKTLPTARARVGGWSAWVLSLFVAVQFGLSPEPACACPTSVLHGGCHYHRSQMSIWGAIVYSGASVLQLSMVVRLWWVAIVYGVVSMVVHLWWVAIVYGRLQMIMPRGCFCPCAPILYLSVSMLGAPTLSLSACMLGVPTLYVSGLER